MGDIYIKNASAILPEGIQVDSGVWTREGTIGGIGAPPDGWRGETVDARGLYLSAGFIDIHTHGIGGFDYMDGGPEPFLGGAKNSVRFGTTTFYPTSVAASEDDTMEFLRGYIKAASLPNDGARMPGVHLEGSYFAPAQAGAQDPRYIVDPDPQQYARIWRAGEGVIKRWSAAPELPGAHEFGDFCTERGILVSSAHTDALTQQSLDAVSHGYTHVTHIYSGMSMVKRVKGIRYGGMVEAAFLSDRMTVEMICDGMHLPKELLQLIYKVKGARSVALVTDSMRAAGTGQTDSVLGGRKNGQSVIVRDGVAWMPSGEAFAGSIATCDRLVRTAVRLADIPLRDAVAMMTSTPARIMGIGAKTGSVAVGFDADLVLFDKDINVRMTIVGGSVVYSA